MKCFELKLNLQHLLLLRSNFHHLRLLLLLIYHKLNLLKEQ
jgi:hypothetical protein